jgi:hypothetical protein
MKINTELIGIWGKAIMEPTTCEKIKSQKLELQVFFLSKITKIATVLGRTE